MWLTIAPSPLLAEGDVGVKTADPASAALNFRIVVPRTLYFSLEDGGASGAGQVVLQGRANVPMLAWGVQVHDPSASTAAEALATHEQTTLVFGPRVKGAAPVTAFHLRHSHEMPPSQAKGQRDLPALFMKTYTLAAP